MSSDLAAGFTKQLPQQSSPHPSFATEVTDETLCINMLEQSIARIHILKCVIFFRECSGFT